MYYIPHRRFPAQSAPPNEISFSLKKIIHSHSLFFSFSFFFPPLIVRTKNTYWGWFIVFRFNWAKVEGAGRGGGAPPVAWLGPPRWQDSAWGSLSVMTVVLTVANISQTLTCIHSFDLHTTLQVDY